MERLCEKAGQQSGERREDVCWMATTVLQWGVQGPEPRGGGEDGDPGPEE